MASSTKRKLVARPAAHDGGLELVLRGSWERLGQRISEVGARVDIVKAESPLADHVPNKVITDIDVLGAIVVHFVMREVARALVVILSAIGTVTRNISFTKLKT